MPKRKLSELEDEEEGVTDPGAPSTSRSDGHEPPADTSSSPASPTECTASTSSCCIPDTSVDITEPSTSSQDGFTQIRKKRKTVKFNGVTVYYFPRKQGFICVPSQGGSTLGMSERHMQTEKYSVGEYAREQRRLHKQILREQQKAAGMTTKRTTRQQKTGDDSSSVASDTSSDSDDELNVDEYYFLQPVPTRQRRILLRQSGIKKIDTVEKEECRDIRTSREMCGCDCRVYCDPETCSCSSAGIKCQVDRLSFPCGCSKDGCSNPVGRIEFNPIRVRTHFIHTVMRLEMDRKREQITQMCAPRGTPCDFPPQSASCSENNALVAQSEEDTAERVETEEKMDAGVECEQPQELEECDSGVNSPEEKSGGEEGSNDMEASSEMEENAGFLLVPARVPPLAMTLPQKSCLKRRADSAKNGGSVTQFNSNERGSCRDCGSTDVTEMLMAGAHFVEGGGGPPTIEMDPIIPSQTKIIDCTGGGSGGGGAGELSNVENGDSNSHPNDSGQHQHFQQVMLFGDAEEEEYGTQDGGAPGGPPPPPPGMYTFKPEDSSYSESSDPDCCSEGSDDPPAPGSAGPPAPGSGPNSQFNSDSTPPTAQHYCIPGSSFEASTAQPEQKYMELNASTSGYKLEPISEILNPLRFAGYESNALTHQSWHHTANATSYPYSENGAGSLPRYPARYPSMQQDATQQLGVNGQEFYADQTHVAANGSSTNDMLPYHPHPATNNNPTSNDPNNGSTYHDNNGTLACMRTAASLKSCDIPPFQSDNCSLVKDTDEDSGFKDLSATSSSASSPVKDDDDVMTPKYHEMTSQTASVMTPTVCADLSVTSSLNGGNVAESHITKMAKMTSVVTSDDDTNCRYTTLLSPQRHGSCDSSPSQSHSQEGCGGKSVVQPPPVATPEGSLYPELNEEYILPKRASVVAVQPTTIEQENHVNNHSSPICQNEMLMTEGPDEESTTTKQQHPDENVTVGNQSDNNTKTTVDQEQQPPQPGDTSSNREETQQQNFGEIIKESIVETVSA